MNAEELRKLDRAAVAAYVWKRLRREPPIDPPLASRFEDEEPEQFLIQAVESGNDASFRRRFLVAVRDNLRRWSEQRAASVLSSDEDRTADEHLASLAFVISELEADDLVGALYMTACSFFMNSPSSTEALTFGQTHAVRTIAQLQSPGLLTSFWQSLWENGPRSLRGLTFFGWARANKDQALARLDELVESRSEIDLSDTVWSLIGPEGPGIIDFARGAEPHPREVKQALHDALVEAEAEFREFDVFSRLKGESTEFVWPRTAAAAPPQPIPHPAWIGVERMTA